MSNCVTVQNEVTFPAGLLDVVKLQEMLTTTADTPKPVDGFPYSHVWWFLNGAVEINADGSVQWLPGCGSRSTHTWRDLQGTIDVFAGIASRPYEFSLTLRDDDAPTPFGRMRFGWK